MSSGHAQDGTGRDLHKSDSTRVQSESVYDRAAQHAATMQTRAVNVPQEQSGVSLHDRQVNPLTESHMVGGSDRVNDTSNPVHDRARETAMDNAGADVSAYEEAIIRQQGVNPLLIDAQLAGAQDLNPASNPSQSAGAERAPTPADAEALGTDGLTLSTADAGRNGIMKQFNNMGGLDEAVGQLRSGIGGGGNGGKSLFGDSSALAQGSMLSPNHHSLQGAANPEFMNSRRAQANESFAQMQPAKRD